MLPRFAVWVAALAGGLLLPGAAAPLGTADGDLITALRRELPALETASRLAAGGYGGPGAAQAQYDAARDLQEALDQAQPVSRGCLSLLGAARVYASGRVLEAEGIDRPSAAVLAAGTRQVKRAAAELARLPHRCGGGRLVSSATVPELEEPRTGEVFYGIMRAQAPPAAKEVEVRVDGKRWAVVQARARKFRFPLRTAPGRHTLELRFLAEGRVLASARSAGTWLLPMSARRTLPARRPDVALAAELATLAKTFSGQTAMWIENLSSGNYAGWNTDARFPAASTVKLAVLVAALAEFGSRPDRSAIQHDLEALAGWSSNLAANRILRKLGGSEPAGSRIAQATLVRLGATSSTYTGDYRVGTSRRRSGDDAPDPPPLVSQRVTTGRDLARILYLLNAATLGDPVALRASGLTAHAARIGLGLLLGSQSTGENVGLFRPALGHAYPIAQKNGWLSDARHTAAILYAPDGPRIAVLLTYRAGLAQSQAARLGSRVARVALLSS
jgi:beta-lactamase class A